MTVESMCALRGTPSSELCLTCAKKRWNGMALSLAKDQVVREAAQQIDMAQKMPTPKTV